MIEFELKVCRSVSRFRLKLLKGSRSNVYRKELLESLCSYLEAMAVSS